MNLVLLIVLTPFFTAPLFYLGSRAKVTHFLWSRYPPRIASFFDCASCSGFWYGLFVALASDLSPPISGLDPLTQKLAVSVAVGLTAVVTTPLLAALHQHAMEFLGSAVDVDDSDGEEKGHDES